MIHVLIDDLAFLAVDAVVRPADETLAPITPAIVRLDAQAGERFHAQRRVSTALEAGAAVVTGGGDLVAPFVLHVVLRDREVEIGREVVRRALMSAWQRAADWGLSRIASPLVGAGAGQLGVEEAARLLAETFPGSRTTIPAELTIVVEREADREIVEAVVRHHRR